MVADERERRESSIAPTHRVILLGASNVTRGISTVVETASQIWGRPTAFFAAIGYGRSYGWKSRVLLRRLPAILECGLWAALRDAPPLPTSALVTDIGNDILYGASVDQIANWVAECLRRLAPISDRITISELPVASVASLDEFTFVVFRSLLYPKSTLQLEDAITKARAVNEILREMAVKTGAKLVSPRRHWFGFDPIHVRRKYWRECWNEYLSAWFDGPVACDVRGSLWRWLYLRSRRPLEREFAGVCQHTPQPSARLADGSTIALY